MPPAPHVTCRSGLSAASGPVHPELLPSHGNRRAGSRPSTCAPRSWSTGASGASRSGARTCASQSSSWLGPWAPSSCRSGAGAARGHTAAQGLADAVPLLARSQVALLSTSDPIALIPSRAIHRRDETGEDGASRLKPDELTVTLTPGPPAALAFDGPAQLQVRGPRGFRLGVISISALRLLSSELLQRWCAHHSPVMAPVGCCQHVLWFEPRPLLPLQCGTRGVLGDLRLRALDNWANLADGAAFEVRSGGRPAGLSCIAYTCFCITRGLPGALWAPHARPLPLCSAHAPCRATSGCVRC